MGFYANDPAVIEAGSVYLRIVGSAYLFQGIELALYFASQGAGTVLWPVAAATLRMVIAVGGAATAVKLGMGLTSIFTMTALGMTIFGVLTALSVLLGAWRNAND